jgi:uncharacterized protein (DUF849 family)
VVTPIALQRVKVCLNGGRARGEHPAVPTTPTELAAAAWAAVQAGAEAVHLHPRAADGRESLLANDIGAAVSAVRRSCPGITIGVSTGLWITGGDVWRRSAQVAAWADLSPAQRPDFASVNLSEPGFAELAGELAGAGIGVEAGVWSVADAGRLDAVGSAHWDGWLRVLVEIIDVPAESCIEEASRVLAAVQGSGLDRPVLLHGEGDACWPLIRLAGRLGLTTRIGLEDVVTSPDGEPVRDNADLVTLALREWRTAAWPN